jgi:hypothetical protein
MDCCQAVVPAWCQDARRAAGLACQPGAARQGVAHPAAAFPVPAAHRPTARLRRPAVPPGAGCQKAALAARGDAQDRRPAAPHRPGHGRSRRRQVRRRGRQSQARDHRSPNRYRQFQGRACSAPAVGPASPEPRERPLGLRRERPRHRPAAAGRHAPDRGARHQSGRQHGRLVRARQVLAGHAAAPARLR